MDSQGGDPERVFVTAADTCTRDLMQCNNAESREAAAQCLRAPWPSRTCNRDQVRIPGKVVCDQMYFFESRVRATGSRKQTRAYHGGS